MPNLQAAQAAANLANDQTFKEVMAGCKEKQVRIFLNENSSQEELTEAHAIVRALGKIDDYLQGQTNEVAADKRKRNQDRGND